MLNFAGNAQYGGSGRRKAGAGDGGNLVKLSRRAGVFAARAGIVRSFGPSGGFFAGEGQGDGMGELPGEMEARGIGSELLRWRTRG